MFGRFVVRTAWLDINKGYVLMPRAKGLHTQILRGDWSSTICFKQVHLHMNYGRKIKQEREDQKRLTKLMENKDWLKEDKAADQKWYQAGALFWSRDDCLPHYTIFSILTSVSKYVNSLLPSPYLLLGELNWVMLFRWSWNSTILRDSLHHGMTTKNAGFYCMAIYCTAVTHAAGWETALW